ncbi:NAD(P)/FAD-dependent oxidoreductase [Ovoidimarina sediminis]|uniref:NAD(P)/FAD-dependent oxidoreductase n=1 Tax=Ovoidimarina sediminis TaxID=3079856 RepID=UPI00290C6D6B|nr:FAD-binding oxidoreductase [Rhodophyticola sp. MJ-SS7]MDU8944225.1 FAD-binding oxidoreductase [Rhodophyticola sp. MJ-SS7]
MTTDVLVIGGGIVGQVAALDLAGAGARVTLVDAGENAGSTANAGSLHVQMQSRFIRLYPDHAPNVERALPFYAQAAALWADLEADLGPMDLVRNGGLMLAESADQMRFLEEKARREEAKGLDVVLLDRAALDTVAPWIGADIVGAELCRNEGKLNPLRANTVLAARTAGLGMKTVSDRIEALEATASGVTARGRKGRYEASEVIVAAAWGSGALVRELGIEIPTAAEPLHMNITEACDQRIDHLVQHAERSITLKQFKTGQIVIGGGWPATDRGRNTVPGVRQSSLTGNVALAARLAPAIGALRVIRTWAGMNTTADGASIIGRLPQASRVVMAVPGDAGYTLGPLVARMAAAIVLEKDPPADPAPFTPARFPLLSA